MYWKEQQEQQVIDFITGNSATQSIAYKKLLPRLRDMVENIMHRYFSVNYNQQIEMREDCIQHIMVRLNNFDYTKGTRAFSYIGTIAKNWFYDIEKEKQFLRTINFEFRDDLTQYENDYIDENLEIDFKAVLSHLRDFRSKLRNSTALKKNFEIRKISQQKIDNLVEVMDLIIEYVEKYENLEVSSIYEYIKNHADFPESLVTQYFGLLFGIYPRTPQQDTPTLIEREAKSIIDDDYTPYDLNHRSSNYKYKKREKMKALVDTKHIFY